MQPERLDSPSLPPSTCLQVLPIKRQRAADQCVEDDSETPNVHLGPIVLLALEKLRGSIGRRATERVQLVAQRELVAEAEVGYLDVGVGIQQKVLRLSHTNMDAEEGEAGMGNKGRGGAEKGCVQRTIRWGRKEGSSGEKMIGWGRKERNEKVGGHKNGSCEGGRKKRARIRDRWGGGWCLRVVQQHRHWT